MDLNHVAVFVRVVETGSFTAAGAALSLPKSSVSRMVAKLEEELGVRLLQRTTRVLRLTDTGRLYYERARQALASLDEASSCASETSTALRGTVRMTAALSLGDLELADILRDFLAEHPDVRVELSLTGRYVDLVEEGFDLAVRGGALEDSSLIARKIGNVDFGLFASPSYLERRGAPTSIADLATHECIVQSAAIRGRTWELTDADGSTTTVGVHGSLEVDELLFVRQAIEAGMGIGLLPMTAVACCAQRGIRSSLVHVLPGCARQGSPLYVVTPSLELAPRRVSVLRDYLVTRLGALLGAGSRPPTNPSVTEPLGASRARRPRDAS